MIFPFHANKHIPVVDTDIRYGEYVLMTTNILHGKWTTRVEHAHKSPFETVTQ